MTLSINMNAGASAQGGVGVGVMTAAGNPWAVADVLAQELVNRGVATPVNWPTTPSSNLSPTELAAFRSSVSGGYAVGSTSILLDPLSATSQWASASAGVPTLAVSTDPEVGQVLTITTDGTTNNHDITRAIVADLTKGDTLSVVMNPASGISLFNIALSLGDTTFTKTAIMQDLSVPGSGGGGTADCFVGVWRTISFGAANRASFVGGAVFADLAKVRAIRIRTKTGTAAVSTLKISQIKRTPARLTGPRIIWRFDDGRLNQYTNAFPILRAAGYTGTMACMPLSWGTVYTGGNNQLIMSAAQFAEMYAAGWEAAGHAETSFSGKTAAQIQTALDDFLNWSITNGYTRGRSHWVYVGGWFDSTSQDIVRRNMLTASRVGGVCVGFQTGDVFDNRQIGNYYNTTSVTAAQIKAKMDLLAEQGNGLLILTFHNVVDTLTAEPEDITTANFQDIVNYAVSNGIKSSGFDKEFGTLWPN